MTQADPVLRDELAALGREEDIVTVERLSGGMAGDPWLISYADGTRLVGKTLPSAPPDLFPVEAEGLAALGATGHVRTPEVLAVTPRLLLMAELPPRDDTVASWEALARDLAGLHLATVSGRFGGLLYLGRGRLVDAVELSAAAGIGPFLRRLPGAEPVAARLGDADAAAQHARATVCGGRYR